MTADLEITKGVTEDKSSGNALLTEGPATPIKIENLETYRSEISASDDAN